MKKTIIFLFYFCLITFGLQSQWIQQSVPVTKPITGIKFINANTGWACTNNGTGGPNYGYIIYTSNGGTNWIIQDSSLSTDYNALAVIDNNIVYAGGDSVGFGKLAKTINGGINWTYIPLPGNMLIDDMQFLNKDSGWACIDLFGPDVRTTTNGGLNWTVRTSGILSQTQKIFFLNYNTGFCGANNNILYKTTNAGVNWNSFYNASSQIYSIFFLNEQTGWVGITNNRIEYTSNSGLNWTEQTISPPSGPIYELYFINNNTGWAGVTLDYIFKTTNAGLNWGYQYVATGSREFCFVDSLRGWCGYLGTGMISATTNGGGIIIYSGINNISTEISSTYALYQNYPNPFNPVTKFKFQIPKSGHINIIIFDVLGKIIKTESDGFLKAGIYEVEFDGSNLPSGIYFYKLITEQYTETKKMILIK